MGQETDPAKREIPAHKNILATRCDVFRTMLNSQMKETKENKIHIEDTRYDVFMALLEYIYSDEIQFSDADMVVALLVEANKYNLARLKSMAENYLAKTIDQENVNELLHLSETHEATELR